jgi:heme exporter protein B
MRGVLALIRRDLAIATRIGGGWELGGMFFLIFVAVVPFALGPDQKLLARFAPAILWLGALLATLFGIDRLFQADEEEGALDQLLLAPLPLELLVLAKCLAHWLATCLPLVLLSPLIGLLLALEPAAMLPLMASLAVGTPAITLIGAVGAALTVSLRRGGLLLAVMVLPLAVPTLIFGVSAANAALVLGPTPFHVPLAILAAITLLLLVVAPVACAVALRSIRE